MKNVVVSKNEMKRKCLEMWQWLANNPGKDKPDYLKYLINLGKPIEFNYCWACEYNNLYTDDDCSHCPIRWSEKCRSVILTCCFEDSPYNLWKEYLYDNPSVSQKAASDIVHLIKTTWKDE